MPDASGQTAAMVEDDRNEVYNFVGVNTEPSLLAVDVIDISLHTALHPIVKMSLPSSFNVLKTFKIPTSLNSMSCMVQQVRTKWADWRMIKDVKRRRCVQEFADQRLRFQTLRKNNILPPEIREIADKDIEALPRDSNYIRIQRRCALTSRPRGVVHKWRLSRIVWRDLADNNKLSGVQRAMW
ncbi:hypothetical protein B566_EDAN012836 [Ephemera danica]|nr:hypothetical protein B566_EDAN012836 [Ephemera danica]